MRHKLRLTDLSRLDPVATIRRQWWALLLSSSRAAFSANQASVPTVLVMACWASSMLRTMTWPVSLVFLPQTVRRPKPSPLTALAASWLTPDAGCGRTAH